MVERKSSNPNMKRIANIHPGEVLKEEFLDPMNITVYRLAKKTGLSQTRLRKIIMGERNITAEIALKLGRALRVSAKLWMNLQMRYDIEEAGRVYKKEIARINPIPASFVSFMRKSPLRGVELDLNREQTPTRKVKFHPDIVYYKGVTGKRARIVGSGVEVWEIIAEYKSLDQTFKRLQKAFHWLTEQQLKAALRYYSFYREEIDALIAENKQWTPESSKRIALMKNGTDTRKELHKRMFKPKSYCAELSGAGKSVYGKNYLKKERASW